MNLPVKHIHKRQTSKKENTLLLLLPAIVFFLTISVLFLSYQPKKKVAEGPNYRSVLSKETNLDN